MSKQRHGRALCRQLVRNRTAPQEFACTIKERAVNGDSELGQVIEHLSASTSPTAQLNGLDAYVYVMAATGNHPRALRAASRRAEICAPSEDLGPVDVLFNKITAWLDRNRYHHSKTQPTPVGHRPHA